MIRNAEVFGCKDMLDQALEIEILHCLKEYSYHHMDTILSLGEISDRLFFVTSGQVGVFVQMNDEYTNGFVDEASEVNLDKQLLIPENQNESSTNKEIQKNLRLES